MWVWNRLRLTNEGRGGDSHKYDVKFCDYVSHKFNVNRICLKK
jgi:hypothetical protein